MARLSGPDSDKILIKILDITALPETEVFSIDRYLGDTWFSGKLSQAKDVFPRYCKIVLFSFLDKFYSLFANKNFNLAKF